MSVCLEANKCLFVLWNTCLSGGKQMSVCLVEHISVCLEANKCLLSCGTHLCLSRGKQMSVCLEANKCLFV